MANLINAHQISKTFGGRPLFQGLTFSIDTGERIGLIGPNGAGKSTLLKILASIISPDGGTLSLQRGLRVGFLEQVPKFSENATIVSTILEAARNKDPSHEWDNLSEAYMLIGQVGLDAFDTETKVSTLSGGWKKRLAIARELMREPDLFLLDEPTNHLDIESILWLEEFLAKAPFSVLNITHDRLFLQKTTQRIIELDPRHVGGLLSVNGDYAHFLESRELLISAQEKQETILKNTLRRETEWLRRGAKARTTKQQARIARHEVLENEVNELKFRNQNRTVELEFQGSDKNPKKLIDAKGLSKKYGDRTLFSNLNLRVNRSDRIGILGRNGTGKSTLIRVILGVEKPTTGEINFSEHLSVAYFEQNRDTLDLTKSVSKTLCPEGDWVSFFGSKIHIRSYLDRFLFKPEQFEMAVGKLSGGEQARLLLARLMMTEANVLVLDEPTNDLDMATLSVLENCLTEFKGAVILVTHDRFFLDSIATKILAFSPNPNGIVTELSSLSQWEDWHEEELEKMAEAKKKALNTAAPSKPGDPPKKRKLSFNDQRELDSMEANIKKAEGKLEKLTEESQSPEAATNAVLLGQLTKKMAAAQAEVDRLYRRWEELAAD